MPQAMFLQLSKCPICHPVLHQKHSLWDSDLKNTCINLNNHWKYHEFTSEWQTPGSCLLSIKPAEFLHFWINMKKDEQLKGNVHIQWEITPGFKFDNAVQFS